MSGNGSEETVATTATKRSVGSAFGPECTVSFLQPFQVTFSMEPSIIVGGERVALTESEFGSLSETVGMLGQWNGHSMLLFVPNFQKELDEQSAINHPDFFVFVHDPIRTPDPKDSTKTTRRFFPDSNYGFSFASATHIGSMWKTKNYTAKEKNAWILSGPAFKAKSKQDNDPYSSNEGSTLMVVKRFNSEQKKQRFYICSLILPVPQPVESTSKRPKLDDEVVPF